MSLTLYFHPLSSFCQKVLVALYENETQFERHVVDLGDETARAAFQKIANRVEGTRMAAEKLGIGNRVAV